MDTAQLAVQLVVGLGSGALGAVVGARSQHRLDRLRAERERHRVLWLLERELRIAGERLMDERTGKVDTTHLREIEREAAQYLPSLPNELRAQLEADEAWMARANYQIGDNLTAKALRLRRYLEA